MTPNSGGFHRLSIKKGPEKIVLLFKVSCLNAFFIFRSEMLMIVNELLIRKDVIDILIICSEFLCHLMNVSETAYELASK